MNKFKIGDKVKGKRTGEVFIIEKIAEGKKRRYGAKDDEGFMRWSKQKDLELVNNIRI